MTIKKLSDIDFMMMDVHRPLTNAEIKEINPQAAVDKSAGSGPSQREDEHREEASMGAPYPYETPLPENVELLNNYTKLDIPVEEILRDAYDAGLVELVVVGIDENGIERVFRTNTSLPRAMFWLVRGQHILNRNFDKEGAVVVDDTPA